MAFRKAVSWTARNLKFCMKRDWWSIRPPSKFQVKIVFISWDMRHCVMRMYVLQAHSNIHVQCTLYSYMVYTIHYTFGWYIYIIHYTLYIRIVYIHYWSVVKSCFETTFCQKVVSKLPFQNVRKNYHGSEIIRIYI